MAPFEAQPNLEARKLGLKAAGSLQRKRIAQSKTRWRQEGLQK
jgi:hypothetical protein